MREEETSFLHSDSQSHRRQLDSVQIKATREIKEDKKKV